ncbi:hypothetical protein GCM10027592_08120 [Spirosoma flavus]
MNNKLLGIIALIGAPFLAINTYLHVQHQSGQPPVYTTNSLSGFFDLLYISGWLCSIIALRQLNATSSDRFGQIMPKIMLITLGLADLWNVYEMILPNHNTWLYHALDMFWPISNVAMLGMGIAVIRGRQLPGWKRYVPLACGLWLPLTAICFLLPEKVGFHLSNVYTALAWTLLALVVLTSEEPQRGALDSVTLV